MTDLPAPPSARRDPDEPDHPEWDEDDDPADDAWDDDDELDFDAVTADLRSRGGARDRPGDRAAGRPDAGAVPPAPTFGAPAVTFGAHPVERPTDAVARPGRTVVAIVPADSTDLGCEDTATVLVRRLAESVAPELLDGWGHDLPDTLSVLQRLRHALHGGHSGFWARVDRARARCAGLVPLTVLAHDVAHTPGGQLLTIEVPTERLSDLLVACRRIGASAGCTADDQGVRPVAGHPAEAEAVRRHLLGTGGRALVFAGQHLVPDRLPVARLLELTAVDAVVSAHGDYAPDARLRSAGYLRPRWEEGRLVLRVGHRTPGEVAPVEVRWCPPCCEETG